MKTCKVCKGEGVVQKHGKKGAWTGCKACKCTGHELSPINVGDTVHVDSQANQWPYERVVDDGTIVDITQRRFLVALKQHRETLSFPRKDCHKT
jgi:DnaJ-class molecular chaperone